MDQFAFQHPLLFTGLIGLGFLVLTTAIVAFGYWQQARNAVPEDPECVGGCTACTCTTSYDCRLA